MTLCQVERAIYESSGSTAHYLSTHLLSDYFLLSTCPLLSAYFLAVSCYKCMCLTTSAYGICVLDRCITSCVYQEARRTEYVTFISHLASYKCFNGVHEVDAIRRVHYITESIIASSSCTTIKTSELAKCDKNVLLLIT